jgi:cysteinyl-tRNA synthetase
MGRDTNLRLYNTRTRAVEAFEPLVEGRVRMYVCGLTPSAQAHLGHARSFLFFDVLRRYLVHRGYRVTYVQNVTDIDDRSIAEGAALGKPWHAVVDGYLASFKQSMTRLHVMEPDREPRATKYAPEILVMIEELIALSHAYVAGDGVYYAVKSFARYGALSGHNTDELRVGARIAPGEDKRDALDFALWKFAKPGEPSWPSPWGPGRPGWHIECSAMSRALLGVPFDIHGGGYDLLFPHHENEVAQSEPLMAKPPMANVWVHGGLLQFDGRKMSKSLGNFEPLAELLDRLDPQAIRLLFLSTGYRKPMNFTEESIEGATAGLRRLLAAYDSLRSAAASDGARAPDAVAWLATFRARFFAALDDDMNTSGALAALFDLAAAAPEALERGAGSGAAALLHEALGIIGLSPNERAPFVARQASENLVTDGTTLQYTIKRVGAELLDASATDRLHLALPEIVPPDAVTPADVVDAVVQARWRSKSQGDFALADRLRVALAECGVVLADSKEGTAWSVAG